MHEALVNKGFTKNKSYEFKIPDMDESLIRHFIRGYFDGDYYCNTNHTYIQITPQPPYEKTDYTVEYKYDCQWNVE